MEMDTHILESFYNRTLPLFAPQAEKLLERLEPAMMQSLSFRYIFSVPAMIEISHIIEDAVLTSPRVAELHVSFQYLSRLVAQAARYKQIAEAAKGLWLYGIRDADIISMLANPQVYVIDTANTPLVRYWYVVAYGPGLSMSLLAEESASLGEEERYYEGFYTFDPEVTYPLLTIMHQIYPDEVPAPLMPDQFG